MKKRLPLKATIVLFFSFLIVLAINYAGIYLAFQDRINNGHIEHFVPLFLIFLPVSGAESILFYPLVDLIFDKLNL